MPRARTIAITVPFASINDSDLLDDGKALGRVSSGTDAYWIIDGDVVDVSSFGGEVVTELDGDEVTFSG